MIRGSEEEVMSTLGVLDERGGMWIATPFAQELFTYANGKVVL